MNATGLRPARYARVRVGGDATGLAARASGDPVGLAEGRDGPGGPRVSGYPVGLAGARRDATGLAARASEGA